MAGTTDTASFGVDLKVTGAESAGQGANELEGLQTALDEATGKLAGMQRAMRNLKGGGAAAASQMTLLKSAIKAQQATIAQTQGRIIQLGGAFKQRKPEVHGLSTALAALQSRASAAGGPLSALGGKLGFLQGLMKAGPYLAVAAAILAVAVASLFAAGAVSKFALASADAYRTERLQLEGLVRVRNWYGLAADKASFLQQQIDAVTASSTLSRDAINGQAQELYRMGLRGGNLQSALEGVTLAMQTQGEVGKAQFLGMALSAGRFGGNIKKVTEDFKARLGPIARAQMLSLDVQARKLRESLTALFSGVKIEGFLEALHEVTSLFSQTTVTGQQLKRLVEVLFNPLFGSTKSLGTLVKRFFQGMLSGILDLTIAVLLLRNWFRKTFADSDLLKALKNQEGAFKAGEIAVKAFGLVAAGAIFSLVVFLGLVVGAVGLVAGAFYAVGYVMKAFYKTGEFVVTQFMSLFDIDWSYLGTHVWQGIVGGLKKGVNAVIDAAKGLGYAIKKAFMGALDSHSPSREMFKAAFTAPQGARGALVAGRPMVSKASAQLGETAKMSFRASLEGFDEVSRPQKQNIAAAALPKPPERKPIFGGNASTRGEERVSLEGVRVPQAPTAVPARAEKPSVHVEIHELHTHGETPQAQAEDTRGALIRVLSEMGASFAIPETT